MPTIEELKEQEKSLYAEYRVAADAANEKMAAWSKASAALNKAKLREEILAEAKG